MKNNRTSIVVLAFIFILSAVPASWGWVRVRGGWGWGWRGPRVGLYLGPGPYWYDPYYYDPYYYPYYPPPPYSYPYVAAPPAQQYAPQPKQSPDISHHNLKAVKAELTQLRNETENALMDGDITKTQHDEELKRLADIEKEARNEFKNNGGYITGDQQDALLHELRFGPTGAGNDEEQPADQQEPIRGYPIVAPPQSSETAASSFAFDDRLSRLRTLLDQKLKGGDITKVQHDRETNYLTDLDKKEKSEAAANGGNLSPDQETALMQQLDRAESAINQNFIAN
jgi:hypothetical protein